MTTRWLELQSKEREALATRGRGFESCQPHPDVAREVRAAHLEQLHAQIAATILSP